MAVNLSPLGGVGAQFFDNSGYPLSGGKLYSYAAGTTTPATTYTSSNGNTAHSNPIVLDAAGRVPAGGEIWLTDGINYKFVLKTSTDTLIATYDNITGINSNAVAYTATQEIQTATAGQTVFTLSNSYIPGTNSLSVFVDGVNQYGPGAQYSYVETNTNTVTFNNGLHVGASVKFTTTQQQGAGAVDAAQVSYVPPFTGSVATNVRAKLGQIVSVKDFGAVGDGVADDTAAVQAAINYCLANKVALNVNGFCRLTASININRAVNDPAADDYFFIFSNTNGGFYVNSSIPMFSTTLTYTGDPVAALICFDNIFFQASDNSLTAYVLDGNKFLRTQFNKCSFSKIRCLSTTGYTQSIYFFNCNMRRWVGVWFNCRNACYDIRFVGNLAEAGVQFALLGTSTQYQGPNGCVFINNCIEGMQNYALQYGAAAGLSIVGNYFEANGIDIDGRNIAGSVTNGGVAMTGNFFSHSQELTVAVTNVSGTNTLTQTGLLFGLDSYYVGKAVTGTGIPPGTTITAANGAGTITISNNTTSAVTSVQVANNAGILWGKCQGCVATGNYALYGMHNMTADSYVEVNDYSVNGPISNTSAVSKNNGYSEGIWSPVVRGAASANYSWATTTAKLTKIGNQVTFMLKGTLTSTGTNSADDLYIPSALGFNCIEAGDLVGYCEVVGSSTNNGVSPLYTFTTSRVRSSLNVIPANTAGQSWAVRAYFTFITDMNGV